MLRQRTWYVLCCMREHSFCSRSSDIFLVITGDGVTVVLQARILRKCDRVK